MNNTPDTINSYEDNDDVVLEFIDDDTQYEQEQEREMEAAAERYWSGRSAFHYAME